VSHSQLAQDTVRQNPTILAGTDLTQARGTILLVEDENLVREVTCEVLESEGYRVLKARDAAEAMEAFRQYKKIVRLLLTDVVLPGQNGCDLAQEMRAIRPSLRTIFISG